MMGKELPASAYTGVGYLKKGKFELYESLYNEVADLLPSPQECPKIIDLGCGVGFFAKVLDGRGYKDYLGIDFSEKILVHAKKIVPKFEYQSINLYSKQARIIFKQHKIFTAIETLEHIKDDLSVLDGIPKDSCIIGSVPSGLSRGHVRAFKGISDVVKRYDSVIEFDFMKTISTKKQKTITIFRGIKI